ncbi:hypothetical protein C7M84_022324 [Penaeus vannamei]|uniref:Uncharacterized protein n=1 Tax=Penaeus vannamei TaxID=6689 RepID=A0A3R7MS36_PENVA|nr:hypothetical protein C7M84_022324 [Penaeus vannamei]
MMTNLLQESSFEVDLDAGTEGVSSSRFYDSETMPERKCNRQHDEFEFVLELIASSHGAVHPARSLSVEPGSCVQKLGGTYLRSHSQDGSGVHGGSSCRPWVEGSGKRALLEVISRRAQGPTRGQILLNHVPMSLRLFQDSCGYVTHKTQLLEGLTAKQTLEYAAKLSLSSKVTIITITISAASPTTPITSINNPTTLVINPTTPCLSPPSKPPTPFPLTNPHLPLTPPSPHPPPPPPSTPPHYSTTPLSSPPHHPSLPLTLTIKTTHPISIYPTHPPHPPPHSPLSTPPPLTPTHPPHPHPAFPHHPPPTPSHPTHTLPSHPPPRLPPIPHPPHPSHQPTLFPLPHPTNTLYPQTTQTHPSHPPATPPSPPHPPSHLSHHTLPSPPHPPTFSPTPPTPLLTPNQPKNRGEPVGGLAHPVGSTGGSSSASS